MIILSPQYEVDITINDQRPLANKIDKDHHSRAWSVLWQKVKSWYMLCNIRFTEF